MAIRRNNAALFESAKMHITELFYARSHPHYQRIMLFDAIQRLFMPAEVKQEWDNNISISVTGDPSRRQDFDFILEEINREIKQFLPIDTSPNDTTWINVCRNKDVLKNVITSLESELGIQSSTYVETLKLSNAVNIFRLKFRRYLASSPDDNLESISGTPLRDNILNIRRECFEKKTNLIKFRVLEIEDSIPDTQTHPVHITDDEYEKFNKVSSMTKNNSWHVPSTV